MTETSCKVSKSLVSLISSSDKDLMVLGLLIELCFSPVHDLTMIGIEGLERLLSLNTFQCSPFILCTIIDLIHLFLAYKNPEAIAQLRDVQSLLFFLISLDFLLLLDFI